MQASPSVCAHGLSSHNCDLQYIHFHIHICVCVYKYCHYILYLIRLKLNTALSTLNVIKIHLVSLKVSCRRVRIRVKLNWTCRRCRRWRWRRCRRQQLHEKLHGKFHSPWILLHCKRPHTPPPPPHPFSFTLIELCMYARMCVCGLYRLCENKQAHTHASNELTNYDEIVARARR